MTATVWVPAALVVMKEIIEGEGRSHLADCFGSRRLRKKLHSPNPCVCPRRSSPSRAALPPSTPPLYKMKKIKEIRLWLSYG